MKLKQLKYRSIEELESQIDRRSLLAIKDPKGDGHELIAKLEPLESTLKKEFDKGDQENNYLNYSRLLILNDEIKKCRLYREDKEFCNLMLIGGAKLANYNKTRNTLREELIKRYDQNKILNFKPAATFNEFNSFANQQDHITCKELFELFEKLNLNKNYLLLIDLRRRDDYTKASIRLSDQLASCLITINIPEDKIVKGSTCSNIEFILNANELNHFRSRNQAHSVILMDYESTSFQSNDKLFVLYQALTKFDTTPYRLKKEPLLLKGGFSDWVVTYPMFCSDLTNVNRTPIDDDSEDYHDDLNNRMKNIYSNSNSGDAVERIYSNKNKDRNQLIPGSAQLFRNPASTNFNNNLSSNFNNSNFGKLPANEISSLNNHNNPNVIYHKIHLDVDEENDNQSLLNNNYANNLFDRSNAIFSKPVSTFKKDSITDDFRNDRFSSSFGEPPSIFSSNNRRSKSYTNLSEMPIDDEDSNNDEDDRFISSSIANRLPNFDRSNKPTSLMNELTHRPSISASTPRDFSPIYGTAYHPTGLKNLGNTCFMNAVIQCLFNVKSFSNHFISKKYLTNINRNSKFGTRGELTEEFGVLMANMDDPNVKYISPKDFRRIVGKHISVYSGCEQQDSHEFLLILFEKLHADLNKAQMIKKTEIPDSLDNREAVDRFWNNHLANNDSIISELFEGLIMSTLECDTCQKKSNTFEVFTCLSLPIPNNSRCDLEDCLKEFTKNENMCDEAAWLCPTCKVKRSATKKTSIIRLPKVLIIHLKRFSFEGIWKQKIATFVDFQMQNLNLRHFISYNLSEPPSTIYDLIGVVDHMGSLEGGHYTAVCKSMNNKWNKYDDQDVNEVLQSEVVSSKAYLLFYVLKK